MSTPDVPVAIARLRGIQKELAGGDFRLWVKDIDGIIALLDPPPSVEDALKACDEITRSYIPLTGLAPQFALIRRVLASLSEREG